jgi:hypothetical protein
MQGSPSSADVADGEDAGQAGLEQAGLTARGCRAAAPVSARQDVARLVAVDHVG